MGYDNRNKFFFGTPQKMSEIPFPVRGMSASPEGWAAGSTFLNGGAKVRHSWDSHKTYDMTWRESTSPEVAQILKSYYDGSYGRGLIHFLDPSTYEGNILPARWADPSLAYQSGASSLVYAARGESVVTDTSGTVEKGYPITTLRYDDISQVPVGYRGDSDSLFIPIPPGHALFAGRSTEDSGGLQARLAPVRAGGAVDTSLSVAVPGPQNVLGMGMTVALPTLNLPYPEFIGVRLWINRTSTSSTYGTIPPMCLRVAPPSDQLRTAELAVKPWTGGMGHSGVRFEGPPSWTTNTAAYGGRISASASFTEVGDWYYG